MGAPKDILSRYSPTTMRDNAKACHYDNLREHGFDARRAGEIAAKAAEHQKATLDKAAAGSGRAPSASSGARSRFRVPFPWEKPEEG